MFRGMESKKQLVILITYIAICGAANMVARVGNQIKPSLSGVDVEGSTFLQRDIVLSEGIVFAYSAYFRSSKPVRLQIWRPVENSTDERASIDHRLLAETRVVPSVVKSREDIYIESRLTEKCIRVQQGDRLGVMFEESPSAIAYVFDDESPTALANRLQNASVPYSLNDVVGFDTLLFPYDFSVAAYVDVDPSHYANTDPNEDFVDCHPLVAIPAEEDMTDLTTTTALPTGEPGATGATGPIGQIGFQGPSGISGPVGATGPIGASGANGAGGTLGADGEVGATGVQGPAGSSGTRGERGEAGPRGPAGSVVYVTGEPGEAVGSVDEGSEFYDTTEMSFGYFVWLIVLSVIVIVLFIVLMVLLCRRKKKQPVKEEAITIDPYSKEKYPSNTELENAGKANGHWQGDMKNETETISSNHTLQRQPKPESETTVDIESVQVDTDTKQGIDNPDFTFRNVNVADFAY